MKLSVKETYNFALNVITETSRKIVGVNEKADQEVYKLESEKRKAIQVIEKEYSGKTVTIKEAAEKEVIKIQDQATESKEYLSKVRRYVMFFDHIEKEGFKKEPEIYYYSDKNAQGNYVPKYKKFVKHVGIVRQDKYNDIRLYIMENGNSVNNLSLIVRGSSFFSDELRDRVSPKIHSYINNCHESNICNIEYTVKVGEFEADLLAYIEKPQNMKRIQEMLPANLDSLAKEYEEALLLFNDPQWKLFYYEDQKRYYEKNVCKGTETKEYERILKTIKKLQA